MYHASVMRMNWTKRLILLGVMLLTMAGAQSVWAQEDKSSLHIVDFHTAAQFYDYACPYGRRNLIGCAIEDVDPEGLGRDV